MRKPAVGDTSISIIMNQRLRPPRSGRNRNVRFAISPPPKETKSGRSSTAYWTRSPFLTRHGEANDEGDRGDGAGCGNGRDEAGGAAPDRATQGEDDHPRSSVRTRGVPRIHLVKVGAVASLPHGKRELAAARGCRWPCGLHPARALGCGSGSRHTAYRRPLWSGNW